MIRLHYIAKGKPQVLRCEPHEVKAAVKMLNRLGINPRVSGRLVKTRGRRALGRVGA